MLVKRLEIRKGRVYAVFIDPPPESVGPTGESGELLLERGVCDREGLCAGVEISEDRLWLLCQSSRREQARQRAMWLLDSRDYTKRSMINKLRPLYGEDAAGFAADYCEQIGLIDDGRYAARLAELMAGRGISDRQAVNRLTAKGIDRAEAERAVRAAGADPAEQLKTVIENKYAARLASGDKEQIERVVAALARKGFGFGDIRRAVSRFCDADNIICEE